MHHSMTRSTKTSLPDSLVQIRPRQDAVSAADYGDASGFLVDVDPLVLVLISHAAVGSRAWGF